MAKANDLTADQRLKRELAMRKAAEAPTIFFEEASTFGVRNQVCIMTLDMGQHIKVEGVLISGRCTVSRQLVAPLCAGRDHPLHPRCSRQDRAAVEAGAGEDEELSPSPHRRGDALQRQRRGHTSSSSR